MKRIPVVISMFVLACGILAADEQPGFRNTNLKVVISVTGADEYDLDAIDYDDPTVSEGLLECLKSDGAADGVTFTEANGELPHLRIDVAWSYATQGTVQISATASVSGLGRGHLFDASSGQAPFTDGYDATKALADDIYRWIHQGWTYGGTPQSSYVPPSYNYGSSEQRFGVFGVGFSLGRGAGLFAGYASFQPLDLLGIEFDYGTQPCATPVGPGQITVWPAMLSAKLQVFGGKRSRSSQLGFELAADRADQAGWGAYGAFLIRLRPASGFNVDFNLGMGHFFNQPLATKIYEERLEQKLGQPMTDLGLGFIGQMPNYLVGGMGICLSF
ncbi:MAG TPA: hypothetical protein VMH22_14935 [bacterium]|nr:hypothetical protein [bacterium]